jgi:hypothetical protein
MASRRLSALEPFSLFDEQDKIGLHPHQQPCSAGAINVGIDQGLHFGALQTNVPAYPGDISLKLGEFSVHLDIRT